MQEIILFAAGIAAVKVLPVPFYHDELLEELQLEEVFMISMFMLLNVFATVSAIIIASIVRDTLFQKPWYKTLFNSVNSGLAAWVAALTAGSIGGLLGAVIGAGIFTLFTGLGLSILFKVLHTKLRLDFPLRVTMLTTATILGVVMYNYPAILPIVASISIGIQMWYRQIRSVEPSTVSIHSGV